MGLALLIGMNTAAMGLPNAPSLQDAGKGRPFLSFVAGRNFQLGTKDILILFRGLIFLIVVVLLMYSDNNGATALQTRVEAFLSLFGASILGMLFLDARRYENKNLLSALFVVDTFFITAGLYLAGVEDTDLFLIFFTTVFISALSQDVKSVFSVALVSCILYGFLEYRTTGAFLGSDTAFLVRFPFLFVAAAMSGFLASETKKHQDEKVRLRNMNNFLAEQADASTQKLAETNRRLKALLEYHHCVLASLKIGVIVARKDGKIRTFNAGARQITGFVEAEMAERELEQLPESLEPVAKALTLTLREEKSYLQDHVELKTDRSESVPVTLETSLLRGGNGEVIGAIATLRDMTLLRQMETQLLRAERLSALGEMAAGVAHEIKNPLNAIMGFSRRLSAKLEEPSLKKYADIIADEVKRMDATINDVLEYSRPDRVAKEPADVHQILEETLAFLGEKLEKAGVEVERFFGTDVPVTPLDVAKVRQVVLNLMLNAIQAMEKGGRLALKTELIDGVVPDRDGGRNEALTFQQLFLRQKMVALSISDTGCGIPKENLPKLFHPFFTTKITGTGLGLSICHKIISSHGGTLDVQSTVGKGSTFTIYLPLEEN